MKCYIKRELVNSLFFSLFSIIPISPIFLKIESAYTTTTPIDFIYKFKLIVSDVRVCAALRVNNNCLSAR